MWIGSLRESNLQPLGFTWKKGLKILGVYISYDEKELIKNNFTDKVQSVKAYIAMWKCRNLSFIGKNLVVKSLLLSKFTYVGSLITVPEEVIKQVDKLTQDFIWNGKRAKLKKTFLMNNYEEGGQNFPDFRSVISALKLKWIKRYLNTQVIHPWKTLANLFFSDYGGLNLLLFCNYDINTLPNLKIPLFYKELLTLWSKLRNVEENEFLWNNKNILVNGKSLFLKDFFSAGIWYVEDFFDANNIEIKPFDFFIKIGIKKNNFVKYYAIANQLRLRQISYSSNETQGRDLFINLKGKKKDIKRATTKEAYQILIKEKVEKTSRVKTTYSEVYNIDPQEWNSIYMNYRRSTMNNNLKDFQYKYIWH